MPQAYPAEFRQRAVQLARQGAQPVARIAADLGIAQSCLRRWVKQTDVDGGHRPGLTTEEHQELVRPHPPAGGGVLRAPQPDEPPRRTRAVAARA